MSPDPFDALSRALGGADTPAAPDPAFAETLKARLTASLARGGLPMTATVSATVSAPPTTGVLTPYLALVDARAAIDWYVEHLGATLWADPLVMADGRIGHATLVVHGARMYLSDDDPSIGVAAPAPGAAAPVTMALEVPSVDAVVDDVRAGGATIAREPTEAHYGRNAVFVDPYGHRWLLTEPVLAVPTVPTVPALPSNGLTEGDVSWVALVTPDADRARRFYAGLLGWSVKPGRHAGWQVEGTAPLIFLWPADDPRTKGAAETAVGYRVDDVEAARARVLAAGGTAGPVERESYGALCDCVDLQGRRFGLHQLDDQPVLAPGARARQGDLSYVTMGVADGGRDRAFYAAVLGWTYDHGNPVGLLPETGIWSPGAKDPQDDTSRSLGAVLCYQVDDIAAAVVRGRELGGTFDEPQRRPYGLESHGRDDQGTELYLHQLHQG